MEKRGDLVYTPAWVAKDMVDYFKPSGVILEPCKGDGVFLEHLPSDTLWCEIVDGINFFEWNTPVDWVISNPPYSLMREWFKHSHKIARNIVYLVPVWRVFSGFGLIKEIHDFGGIRNIRLYGTGSRLGFPMGNAIGAIHIERDYCGKTEFSFAEKGGDG